MRKLKPVAIIFLMSLVLLAVIKPVIADERDYATITGTVYNDKNDNGKQEENEEGIANVTVSDGKTLAVTDEHGNYELRMDIDRRIKDIVFVTVPNGYRVPTDENQTPQFYKQLGELKKGMTQKQNFGLLPNPESNNPNFSFVNLADVHVQEGTTNNRERFTDQLAQVNQLSGDPAFIAVSGDLTNRATHEEFQDYTASTAASDLPVYPAVGNHDFAPGSTYAERIDRYRKYLGPEWYSFNYGQKHFVTLENILGFKESDQIEWLKKDLELNAKDKEVIVIVHKPMNTPQTPAPTYTKQFKELLAKYNARLVLVGHTHVNDVAVDTIPGAKHITTNSSSYTIDQTPNGFRKITFKGEEADTQFKMYGVEKSLSIVNPSAGGEIPQEDTGILVNAYNTTSLVQKVKYRIDGGPWESLNQSSDFTWMGEWHASETSLGEHSIEVRVTDDKGDTWSKVNTFTIVESGKDTDPKPGANWSMFHGNAQHTGVAKDELEPGLKLDWSYKTPGSILTSSPAIVDGIVYIGTRDESNSKYHAIHAVDLKTGKKLWQFKANAQVQSSPAVEDGVVYASTVRGTLYALEAKTGDLIWKKTIGKDSVQRAWMYYSPTVSEGTVYQAYSTGKGGELMALDSKTGEVKWKSPLAGNWISEASAVVKDGKVYVGGDGGWLFAFDAKTGEEIWRHQISWAWMHSMPTIADGRIHIGHQGGQLVTLDASTGEELWRYRSKDASYIPGDATGSTPAVKDGIVYMGFPDGNVTALDAKTGQLKWKYRTEGGIISSPVVSGKTVYIGSNDGRLYGLDSITGQPLWNHEIGTWVASTPAISGNTLLVGAFDGNLYAFTPGGEAAERWPKVTGKITDKATNEPIAGATITIKDDQGEKVRAVQTDKEGRYLFAVESGSYTIQVSRLGYQTKTATLDLTKGNPKEWNVSLTPVSVDASTGKTVPGPRSEATTKDIVMENSKLAMAIAKVSEDSQLSGVTKGKPIDVSAKGFEDQIDWMNLPYVSAMEPTGTGAWQQLTAKHDNVEIAGVTADQAVVKATGQSTENPEIEVETTYTIGADQALVKTETVFTNTGSDDQTLWVGDVMDYDGAGQKSGVSGQGVITNSYSNPEKFSPNEPWIGMTGTDNQVYGFLYTGDMNGLSAYGNGNWMMTKKQIELSPSESFTLTRYIAAIKGSDSTNPFTVLSNLYQQITP